MADFLLVLGHGAKRFFGTFGHPTCVHGSVHCCSCRLTKQCSVSQLRTQSCVGSYKNFSEFFFNLTENFIKHLIKKTKQNKILTFPVSRIYHSFVHILVFEMQSLHGTNETFSCTLWFSFRSSTWLVTRKTW